MRRADNAVDNASDEVLDLLDSFGIFLDSHQELAMSVACDEKADGTWAARQFGWSEPRQNGKSLGLLGRTLAGVLLFEEPRIIHSAHEVKTAMESYRNLVNVCENFDSVRKRVKRFVNTNGREGVEFYGSASKGRLTSGTNVTFVARSKGSARGFSAALALLDEAQEMSFEVLAAILPTLSAVPNSQLWMCGTPPDTAHMNGEVFTRQRETALRGLSPRQAWIEWGAGDSPTDTEYDAADPVQWMKANPACPERIELTTIEDEYHAMSEETFRRDRLGQWDNGGSSTVIPLTVWDKQAAPDTELYGNLTLAIDVSPTRGTTSIALAGYTDTRKTRKHVKLLLQGPGTDWVVDYVRTLVQGDLDIRSVVIDSAGPVASLAVPLRHAGVQVTPMGTRFIVDACGQAYDGFVCGGITHEGQDELTDAMEASEKRVLMDAWALSRKNSDTDITAFVAATLALYGVGMLKVKRPKIGQRGKRKVSVSK